MKKLTAFGAALAAAFLSFSSFGRTFVVSDQATFESALAEASEEGGDEIVINEDTISLNTTMVVNKPVVVRGAGLREDTTLKITVKNLPVIEVDDENAVLKNVTITGSNVGYGQPNGGLTLKSGLVTNVVIKGNSASAAYAGPAAVKMSGGRLTGSLITENKGAHAAAGSINVGGDLNNLIAGKGPEIDHCQIVNNTTLGTEGSCNGTVGLNLAYMHDCLIANNTCEKGNTAGVQIGSYGVLANCTIANNSSGAALAGGLFWANQNLARVVNCIVAGNTCTGGNCDWGKTSTAKDADLPNVFLNCLFDGSDIGGTNCKVGDPGFKNAAAGDYTLTAASALARDTGLATWSGLNGKVTFTRTADETDFAGNSRIMGSAIDIGAYEFDPNVFSVGFSCETLSGSTATTYQFRSEVLGASGDVTYGWTFKNDMTGDSFTSDEANPAFTTEKAGSYTVTLVVDDGVHEPLTETKASYVSVLSPLCYADPDSVTPVYPYDTEATAAKTLQEAYDACAAGGEVVLAAKTFEVSSRILIDRALTIRGKGAREDTVIQAKSTYLGTLVAMNSAGAVLKNVTLAGGTVDTKDTGALNIGGNGGTVTNCIIRDCVTKKDTIRIGPAALQVTGGRVTGCLITGNRSCHDSTGSVNINGTTAVMDHCQVLNNTVTSGKSTYGALCLGNGLVEDCLIAHNTCDAGFTPGVYFSAGGLLRNCTITQNDAGNLGAAGGLYWNNQDNARIVNCIVVGNAVVNGKRDWDSGNQTKSPANVFHNCVFDGAVTGLNDTNHLLDPSAGETVGFVDSDNGDYSLTSGSWCIDKGTEATELGGKTLAELLPVDIAGNDRVMGATVDIGAFEYDPSKMSCDFAANVREGFPGQQFTLSAIVGGGVGDRTYAWRIACGDTVLVSEEENPTVVLPDYGQYDVSLTVTTEAGMARAEKPGFLYLAPRDIYATQGAAAENFPFASAEDATANLQAAYDAAISGSVIHVSGTLDLSAILTVTKAVTFTGVSGSDTDKIRQTANMRVLNVNCAGAVFRGLTLTGGKAGSDYYSGNGVYVGADGGVFEDCCFLKNGFVNSVTAPAPYGAGGGVYVSSGAQGVVIRRCIFRENVTGSGTSGAGAVLGAGLVEDCLFEGNYMDNGCGSAVYLSSPTVKLRNCTFVGNHGKSRDASLGVGLNGAIYFAADSLADGSPEVVNCLFDGNYLKTADEVANWSAHPQADADNLAAAFTTCAFTAGELPVADDETKAMLVADPGFTDDGTYRLTKKTALRGKGTYQAWMDGTTDLYGMPRVGVQNEVEPGCCAAPKVYGFMLLVR